MIPRKYKLPLLTGCGVAVAATALAVGAQMSSGAGVPQAAPAAVEAAPNAPTVADQAIEEFTLAREAAAEHKAQMAAEEAAEKEKKAAKKRAEAKKKAEAEAKKKAEEQAAKRRAAEEKAARAKKREAAESAGNGGTPSQNRALGMQMCADAGFSSSQCADLGKLWQKESGWDHRAANRSSGAYGIPQSLPGSKMGSAGSDWRTNPRTQIEWGLDYIKGRYGNPSAAWAHSQSRGWY